MNVGFVGLGNMGAPIAPNLLQAGHRATVYNRTRGKAESLEREGARRSPTASPMPAAAMS
jgi:3-hydroxyisobutyrate dehydrogenase-like beta-hydroxyacid dehydrogenase